MFIYIYVVAIFLDEMQLKTVLKFETGLYLQNNTLTGEVF